MSWVAAAIGGSAVLGAGASIYGANKAASAAQAGQRNLGNELDTITGRLPALNAAGLANQQQYAGLYNTMGQQNLDQGLFGNSYFDARAALAAKPENERASIESEADKYGISPEEWLTNHTLDRIRVGDANAISDFQQYGGREPGLADTLANLQGAQDQANAASATYQRTANQADMEALAPRAADLYRQVNPELFANLDRLDAAAGDGTVAPGAAESAFSQQALAAGPSRLESLLEEQAAAELALGDQLSDDEARRVRVQSRAAADARGRGFSNAALADEVLNTSTARQNRLDARRGFAGNVNTLVRSGQSADRSFLGQAASFDALRRSEGFNRLLSAANARGATAFNPASTLGTVDNRLNSTTTLGIAQQQFQGAPDYLSSLLGYGNNLFGNNANAAMTGATNTANAYSAFGGGLLSAAGSLGGAYLMNQPQQATGTVTGGLF